MSLSTVSATPVPEAPDGMQGRARQLAMAVIVCGLMLCVLDSTMLNLALPPHSHPAPTVKNPINPRDL